MGQHHQRRGRVSGVASPERGRVSGVASPEEG